MLKTKPHVVVIMLCTQCLCWLSEQLVTAALVGLHKGGVALDLETFARAISLSYTDTFLQTGC